MDTLITRMQSPTYLTQYKTVNGSVSRSLFLGLYQGFGPTIVASMPSSAAFFAIYEGLGGYCRQLKEEGHLSGTPLPLLHGMCGAAASIVSCAITNPAEVLKQNAQVYRRDANHTRRQSPTLRTLKLFSKHPIKLWAGYTALVASHLPSTTVMMCLYEALREQLLGAGPKHHESSMSRNVLTSGLSAAVAGGVSSSLFVPIDVVQTRMRLAAGDTLLNEKRIERSAGKQTRASRARLGPLAVARGILLREGVSGLFRGAGLTVVASAIGSGLYFGCYEFCKAHFLNSDYVS